MYTFSNAAFSSVQAEFERRIKDESKRETLAKLLEHWLKGAAIKRADVDVLSKIDEFRPKIAELVKHLRLEIVKGKVVLRVSGSAEATLKQLQYGSSWFNANDNLVNTVLAGIFNT